MNKKFIWLDKKHFNTLFVLAVSLQDKGDKIEK